MSRSKCTNFWAHCFWNGILNCKKTLLSNNFVIQLIFSKLIFTVHNRYDVDTNQQCIVNTSNLNEELGQVIFLYTPTFKLIISCRLLIAKYSFTIKIAGEDPFLGQNGNIDQKRNDLAAVFNQWQKVYDTKLWCARSRQFQCYTITSI